jgi:hypothetical protein
MMPSPPKKVHFSKLVNIRKTKEVAARWICCLGISARRNKSTMAAEFSHYDLLGVESSATRAEIHSAYRMAALRYNPDINSAPNATRLTAMLNEAHRVLSTTVGLAAYDATLASSRATSGVSRDQWSLLGGLSAALFFPWLFAWRMAVAKR